MYYDIVDQDGNPVKQKLTGYFNSSPGTEYHVDEAYEPFDKTLTSITIKPYTVTAKKGLDPRFGQRRKTGENLS